MVKNRISSMFSNIIKGLFIFMTVAFLASGRAYADMISLQDLQSINAGTAWYDPNFSACGEGIQLVGSDNLQQSFNFLTSKGLTAIQASAIIGNLEQESGPGLNPNAQQAGGKSTSVPTPGVGFGIAQWTSAGRQAGLVTLAEEDNKPATDLGVQLSYLWDELNGQPPAPTSYTASLQALQSTSDIEDATVSFMNTYESPNALYAEQQNRINYAEAVLTLYGTSSPTTSDTTSESNCSENCTNNSGTVAAGLSETRQNIVCIAEQELTLWQSQSAGFAETGYYKYSDNTVEEWCADFASWVYDQSGDPFTGGLSSGWRLPAVAEIETLGQQNSTFHWHPAGSNYTPQPGDLAIHAQDGIVAHVNIFISSNDGVSEYIGGDQPGPGGDDVGQSVVSMVAGYGNWDTQGSQPIIGYVSPD
jgi:hypothetical protein